MRPLSPHCGMRDGRCRRNEPSTTDRKLPLECGEALGMVGTGLAAAGVVFASAAAAGSFQSVGSTAKPRWDPVVVTLADGSALVIGGWKEQEDKALGIAMAERFDPKTDRFTPAGPMIHPRDTAGATLLGDGRALIAGGFGIDPVSGRRNN
jgi:hypothetical protein